MSEQEQSSLPDEQAPRWRLSALSNEELSELALANKDDKKFWEWAYAQILEFSDEALFICYRISGVNDFGDAVYHQLRPKIASLIKRIIGDHARAEDLTQDAMVRILKSKFDPQQGELLNFALKIASNLAWDEFRLRHLSQWRDFVYLDAAAAEDEETLGAVISDTATPDPYEVVLSHEQTQAIRHCLGCLGEVERRLLEMWAEGVALQEIADVLGCTYTALTTRKNRALQKLRLCYEKYEGGQLL